MIRGALTESDSVLPMKAIIALSVLRLFGYGNQQAVLVKFAFSMTDGLQVFLKA